MLILFIYRLENDLKSEKLLFKFFATLKVSLFLELILFDLRNFLLGVFDFERQPFLIIILTSSFKRYLFFFVNLQGKTAHFFDKIFHS